MTPKNRTLEGKNRTLGVEGGSKIVENRRTSFMYVPLNKFCCTTVEEKILELGILDCKNQKIEVLCRPHEQSFGLNEAKNVGAIRENEQNVTHLADINLHTFPFWSTK